MSSPWVGGLVGFSFATLSAVGIEQTALTVPMPDGSEVKTHVFAPKAETPASHPTLILWHGGGWTAGQPALLFPHAEEFAAAGYFCLVPEYPLANAGNGLARCVEDARQITDWIMSEAGPSRIDRSAVYLLGESAGGHLAAMLASDPTEHPWAGLVLWNPVLDLREIPWLESKRHGPLPDRAAFSPITRLSSGHAPTLILHGANDKVVPVEQATDWRNSAHELKVPCRLRILPETAHAFSIPKTSENPGPGYREAMQRTLNFLRAPKTTIDREAETPFHIVHTFSPETGWQPFSELSLQGDTAWGAAHTGGRMGRGTLFRVDLPSETLEVMHLFSGADGYEPYTGNTFTEDTVWGITKFGGPRKGGTLYRYTPSRGELETLADFGPNGDPVAWNPHAGPILVDGYLWGTTFHGGPTRWGGGIYRIPQDGGGVELMHGFTADSGEHPTGQLLFHEGWIYGTLSDYGKTDPGRAGALFRIRPDGSAFEVVHRFAGGGLGAHPYDRLVAHPEGFLLGTTFGRFGDPHDGGTLFSWDPTTEELITLIDFNLLPGARGKPNGSVALEDIVGPAATTLLLTTHGDLDAVHGFPGSALRVHLAEGMRPRVDRIEILHTFNGNRLGSTPMRTPLLWNGDLWGMTAFGHNTDAEVVDQTQTGGLLYRLDLPAPLSDDSVRSRLWPKNRLLWIAMLLGAAFITCAIFLLLRKP